MLVPRLIAAQSVQPPYRDPALPVESRVRDLLGRMTLEEKFWQLFMIPGDLDTPANDYSHGIFGLQIPPSAGDTGSGAARAHAERINAIQHYFVERTRLGIPIIPFDEALHGFAREGATVFPQAIGLAATWDTTLMARVAGAIARETRSRGVRQVLSPVINIASDVRWGRVEETYGEDQWLSARMAVAFVGPLERAGVVTTPKHFVANVGEGGRDSYPIEVSERRLEEYYFPPFKAAIGEGGADSSSLTLPRPPARPCSISPKPALRAPRVTHYRPGSMSFSSLHTSSTGRTGRHSGAGPFPTPSSTRQ
jgi:beta-glucosidase